MRRFITFSLKQAHYRIASDRPEAVIEEIRRLRLELEAYIKKNPEFASSYGPVAIPEAGPGAATDIPEAAGRMLRAAEAAGVGPMAAVAGTFAQMAAEAAVRKGAAEAIVENGGDIYLYSGEPVTVGIYAERLSLKQRLAFSVAPDELPLALCSSSSSMGHSTSFGACDLVTVTAKDASLADAAATGACNMVRKESDIAPAAEFIASIPGIAGVFIVKGKKIGMAGRLPSLAASKDPNFTCKITRDPDSNFAL